MAVHGCAKDGMAAGHAKERGKMREMREMREEREREGAYGMSFFPKRTQVGWSIRNRHPRVLAHGASRDSEVAFSLVSRLCGICVICINVFFFLTVNLT